MLLKRGHSGEWLKQKGKLGGQHKVPRLSNERNLIEEMIAMVNTGLMNLI